MGSAQTDTSVKYRTRNGEFDLLYMTPERAVGASIFGGLQSDDIIWEEYDTTENGKSTRSGARLTVAVRNRQTKPVDPGRSTQESSDLIACIHEAGSEKFKIDAPCALMDTRLLPGRAGNEHLTQAMLLNIYGAFRKSKFSELLHLPKVWTFIANQDDADVLRCSLDSILDKKGFAIEEAYYKPHCDEEIVGKLNFFDRPFLVLLHVFWPQENLEQRGNSVETHGRPCNEAVPQCRVLAV